MYPVPEVQGPTLDVKVLEGLENYIATEQFLHKLEQAGAEWIDLSEHQHHPPASQQQQPGLELTQVNSGSQQCSAGGAAAADQHDSSAAAPRTNSASSKASSSSYSSGFFSRWNRPSSVKSSSSSRTSTPASSAAQCPAGTTAAAVAGPAAAIAAAVEPESTAASTFEVIEQQPPLHQELPQQEPFVMVSADDAIEGMAYYIALYLSRAPEAKHMDPKQLQAALKQTMTSIRRSRYRVVWDWGRTLYRWGAVSYSALQLYEHPWVVRALLCAIWTSSKMAVGLLV